MQKIDKDNPFEAKIIERFAINKPGSKKCTMYLKLDISGSHLEYKTGDSIAVFPENDIHIVLETLKAIKANGDEIIKAPRSGQEFDLKIYLLKKANISRVTKKWLTFILEHLTDENEQSLLKKLLSDDKKDQLKAYCNERQLWDFLKEFKSIKVDVQRFVDMTTPLLPRFYSIASSQKKHPNEIDLLIAYFKYSSNDHLRFGVASHYLCHAAQMHTNSVPLYLHPSKGFTIPKDPKTPLIMVGPGTGLAPFIGFLQERVLQENAGPNWLFFGDWNKEYDFFFQDYLEKLESENKLKLSTAFSRDQENKVYVQHKMKEHRKELFEWLEKGAIFCVCGDATHMAKDVDQELNDLLQQEGNMSLEDAKEYLKKMRLDNRYLRDVY